MGERPTGWELVIFDNDGVLVDSERIANTVLARQLSALGRPTSFEESVATFLGGSIGRVRTLVESDLGHALPASFESSYHAELFAEFDRSLAAVPGVVGELDDLDGRGTTFCVASSGSHARIRHTLERVRLWERFAGRVFSADDVAAGKPAPDLFLHAAATLAVEPAAAVVVEDSPLGVEAARAAGMHVVGYAAVTPAARLAGADEVVATMAEVRALLAG